MKKAYTVVDAAGNAQHYCAGCTCYRSSADFSPSKVAQGRRQCRACARAVEIVRYQQKSKSRAWRLTRSLRRRETARGCGAAVKLVEPADIARAIERLAANPEDVARVERQDANLPFCIACNIKLVMS